jgi:hypothetical protein
LPAADHRMLACSSMRAASSSESPKQDAAPHIVRRLCATIVKPSGVSSLVKVTSPTVCPPQTPKPMQTAQVLVPHMLRPSISSPPVTMPKNALATSNGELP